MTSPKMRAMTALHHVETSQRNLFSHHKAWETLHHVDYNPQLPWRTSYSPQRVLASPLPLIKPLIWFRGLATKYR